MKNQAELKQLKAIADFLPDFKDGKGLARLDQFVQTAYANNWVRSDINWTEWQQTPEAEKLRDDPIALAHSSRHDLACLLTTLIRQERFCEGSLESDFASGLLIGILQRAASILDEIAREHETENA